MAKGPIVEPSTSRLIDRRVSTFVETPQTRTFGLPPIDLVRTPCPMVDSLGVLLQGQDNFVGRRKLIRIAIGSIRPMVAMSGLLVLNSPKFLLNRPTFWT